MPSHLPCSPPPPFFGGGGGVEGLGGEGYNLLYIKNHICLWQMYLPRVPATVELISLCFDNAVTLKGVSSLSHTQKASRICKYLSSDFWCFLCVRTEISATYAYENMFIFSPSLLRMKDLSVRNRTLFKHRPPRGRYSIRWHISAFCLSTYSYFC